MEFKNHPLWHFTIEAHGRPGVHEACMALQIDHHVDVNFLFWCCWIADVGGGPLADAQVQSAMEAVGQWQREIVRPVWKARWKLKPSYGSFPKDLTEALRRELIAAELSAEHIELLHLANAVEIANHKELSLRDKTSHAAANLALYLSRHFAAENEERALNKSRNPMPENIQAPLYTVLCACFPELKAEEALQILKENFSN